METTKEKMSAKALQWLGLEKTQKSRACLLALVMVGTIGLSTVQMQKQFFSSQGVSLSVWDKTLMLSCFVAILATGALTIGILYRKERNRWQAFVFFQMFCLGMLIRFLLVAQPFALTNGDITGYLQPWCVALRELPFRQAVIADVGNYTMPYRMVLAVIAHTPFTDIYCIKLLSILFDAGVALMIWLLARRLGCNYPQQLTAFALPLFLPTFFLNSAFWGQCDAIYTFFCLLALYFGIWKGFKSNSALCWLVAGIALSLKLQAIFLLPALLILCMSGRIRFRESWVYLIGLALMNLPAFLFGCPLSQMAKVYLGQTGEAATCLEWNATTLWTLFPFNMDETIGLISMAICGALFALFLYVFVDDLQKMNELQLVLFAAIATLTIIYLLPGMHERYFYLAEALLTLYMIWVPKNAWAAATLYMADFTRYASYLFQQRNQLETASGFFSAEVQALLLGLAILWIIRSFYQGMRKEAPVQLQKQ